VGALRLTALILFGVAAGCAFGWWFHATTTTDLGLVAAGLLFYVLSGYVPAVPVLPVRE
jgi:hypothetical protein